MSGLLKENLVPSIVLVETSHSGNIGSVARAMKTMGLNSLKLVRPKCDPQAHIAYQMSSGAEDILDNVRIYDTIHHSCEKIEEVIALSYRKRSIPLPVKSPREYFDQIESNQHSRAFVFGNEQSGLSNRDLDDCHLQMAIPSSKDFPSLNLAASVQIICYEWAVCASHFETHSFETNEPPAESAEIASLRTHCQNTLSNIGVIRKAHPEHTLRRVNRMINRYGLTKSEVAFLRGILTAVDKLT